MRREQLEAVGAGLLILTIVGLLAAQVCVDAATFLKAVT